MNAPKIADGVNEFTNRIQLIIFVLYSMTLCRIERFIKKKICVSCSINKADCTHKSIEKCIKSENMVRDTMPRNQENVSINISTAFLSLK